jgi:hypothetical protein
MTSIANTSLEELCKRLEAYATPRWAVESILDVELTTRDVLDPCAGLGVMGEVCMERGLRVQALDVQDWREHFPGVFMAVEPVIIDFFNLRTEIPDRTVIMNPPFSLAEKFVDHARALGARKVICFQRQAWRESAARRLWWDSNAPARVWVCGARASCWRFDLLQTDLSQRGGSSVSMAWYIWERGHKSAEVTSAIYPGGSA